MPSRTATLGALLAAACLIGSIARADSIAFVLGEDRPDDGFYRAATHYYAEHPDDRVEHLELDVRSFASMHARLARSDSRWRRIVLVVHGSPWTGLDLSLFGGDERVDANSLARALALAEIPPLPSGRIDGSTVIRIEACALGRSQRFLDLIAAALADEEGVQPSVLASVEQVYFLAETRGVGPRRVERAELAMSTRALRHPNPQPGVLRDGRRVIRDWPVRIDVELSSTVPVRSRLERSLDRVPEIQAALAPLGLSPRSLLWQQRIDPHSGQTIVHGSALLRTETWLPER